MGGGGGGGASMGHGVFIKEARLISNNFFLRGRGQILHNLCFSFLLGITAVPREIENNTYAK